MKKNLAIVILFVIVCIEVGIGLDMYPAYRKGIVAIEKEKTRSSNEYRAEQELEGAKRTIAALEKSLATDPEALKRVFRINGFTTLTMNRSGHYKDYYICEITLWNEHLQQKVKFSSQGDTPEAAMLAVIKHIDKMRAELCSTLEEGR